MIANYVESERKEITTYEIVFDDGANNGYCFPCDQEGHLDEMSEAAKKNYEECLKNPEQFFRYNKLVSYTRSYREPARGKCRCGETVYLTNDYLGSCECPKCGQWYNVWGQELLSPDRWNDEY